MRYGTVGQALPRVQTMMSEDGELLVKGPSIMSGYFDNPKATKAVFNKDGWFLTGDIVEISPDGYIKIIDRKKELLVLSNGKKIAPLPIEKDLRTSRYISQVVVIGENRNYLIAIIVPNFELLAELTNKTSNPSEQIKDPAVIKLFEDIIQKKMVKQASYKQIKKFILLDAEFSQEAGELTPTLKIKRRVILEKYGDLIEGKYNEDERGEL
jgi:long-chain acyl-CoA synthetase